MPPSVRVIFGDKSATPAVLTFLRNTQVEKIGFPAPRGEQCFSV